MIKSTGSSLSSTAEAFELGDYATAALRGADSDWRTFAALGLIGNAARALEGLRGFDAPEARFYEAATQWIDGQEKAAVQGLARCDSAHARQLLALIRKPKIRVLAQCDRGSQWDLVSAIQKDTRFDVVNVGFSPQDKPNRAYADVRQFCDPQNPPDFYVAKMVEWHLLPPNLQQLSCPLFGHTADYDLHIQTVRPWLSLFDELLTTDQTEWRDVSRLTKGPVAVFPKAFAISSQMPPLTSGSRPLDVFVSGTTLHPYHPDKARLLHQILRRGELRVQFLEGFLPIGPYLKILNSTRGAFTYIRHPGGMPTRGMEALAMGAAIAVQKESVLRAYLSEMEGVVPYDSDSEDLPDVLSDISRQWETFEPRAARGAAVLRRDFSAERIAGQYFRFLAFLAAKPRGPRPPAPEDSLRQKRVVFCKGWAWHPAVSRAVRQRSTHAWAQDFNRHPSAEHLIHITRELVLEHATGAHRPAAQTVQASFAVRVTVDSATLARALEIFRLGMDRFPRSLALRFNAIRTALYFGEPEQVTEGLGWAREAVSRPTGDWLVTPDEDVFPWDFFSQMFNYRAYFDRCTEHAKLRDDRSSELIPLLLASIAYHLSCYPDGPEGRQDARVSALQAVKWDPEFPFYSLRAARLLMETGAPAQDEEAVALLQPLVSESMLHPQAAELLRELRDAGRAQSPRIEALLAEASLARERIQSTATGREDWSILPLRPAMPRNADSSPAPVASGGDISVNEGVDAPPRKRILYLCLEFALWQHARKLAYPAGLGLEEGFDPREIECVTLPSICGLSKAAREAWQSAIQARCAGQRFDQVWFELVHSEWDEGFLGWLASLAPVRVGLIMESLRYEPDVYAQAPHLLNRHAHVEKRLRHATHALCIDEADAEELQQRGQPALWWPQAVPARFMTPFSDEGPDRRGVFLGSVYGGRGGWLAHPDLLGCLTTMTQAPEDSTSLPAWFDEMQRQWETLLLAGPAFCQDGLPAYMETWRRIRSDCFRGWIQALRGCGSVVNLPSYVRGYAGRVYEAMAAGRPAVSWEIPDRPRSRALFREGEEILHFQRDNPSSLSEALGRLQSDPVFARSVAERGADSVRRHHTVERRVEQVMRWIDSNETPDFTSAAHTATAARPARLLALDPPRTPQTASLTAILGRMRQAQGDSLQASEAFDAALTARASDASLWLARAAAARDQSDLRAFRAAWESAVKCGAGDPAVCRDLCDVCAEHGHRDLAARLSDRLFNHSPEDLGIVVDYLRHRRQGAASRRTPTEWVLDRSWMEALAAQVEAAFDKEEANTATSMAQRVIQVGDLAEARALMEAGKRAEAWTKAQEAILARPFHPAGWLLLSAIALQSGETLRARQCAQEALRLAPKWKEAKSWLAAIPKKPAVPSGSLPELNPGLLGRGVRLTVCVIARNEEKFLARCLASARPIAQQIIVVDTGSTDRTVEIAREAGAEVHGFQWCDDFSAARNAALERARGDWVLQLDADEELVEETRDRLRAATQDASMLAYRLPLADVGKEKEGFHHVPRLFRNAPGVHYKGRVHEHAFGSLEPMQKEWGLQNGIGKVQILHHGYVDQVVKDRSKVQRNLRLLERAIEENPEDASLLMSFGLDLVRSGQMDAGLEEYAKAFRSMSRRPVDATPPELRERLLTLMCSHLITAQRFQTVIEVSETPQASAAGPTASLHMLFGLAHFVQQNYASAASHLKQCVAKRQRPTLSPLLPDTLSGAPRHLLALSYDKLGEKAEAEKQFTASLAETPEATNVRMDFAKHLQREAKRVQALEQLHAIIAQKPSELMAWRMGAEIALRDAAFLDFAVDWTAEAIKAFPRDQTLAAARGEALMLRGAFGDAAPFWDQARADQNPRHDAAFLFCRLQVSPASLGETRAPGAEARISQEFCDWFRAVVSSGNESAIRNLSSRLDALRPVLPTAASRIESVLKEAQAA